MSALKKYLGAEKIVGDIKRIDVFEKALEEAASLKQLHIPQQTGKNLLTEKSLTCLRPLSIVCALQNASMSLSGGLFFVSVSTKS